VSGKDAHHSPGVSRPRVPHVSWYCDKDEYCSVCSAPLTETLRHYRKAPISVLQRVGR